MQLGTRWAAGATPPARLPDAVIAAIAEVESGLDEAARAHGRWQLTWLEGRPIVESDAGTIIRYDAVADAAIVTFED